MQNYILKIFLLLIISGCSLKPSHQIVEIVIPDKFREYGIEWNKSNPNDQNFRGEWWRIFNDKTLNELEQKLTHNNQNIIAAKSSYEGALALVKKARTGYLPIINSSFATSRSGQKVDGKSTSQLSHAGLLNASWEPDLWGNIANTTLSNIASSEIAKAQLASTILSSQTSLAQYYFELRTLDKNQILLDNIILSYKDLLQHTQNRYALGVGDQTTILLIHQQLQSAEILSINNQINRAQYQNAIALLIGEPASTFSLTQATTTLDMDLPIPIGVPSTLLERRPDIASAERSIAKANAQIGIAKSSFFPSLILSGTLNRSGNNHNILSLPNLIWSVGPSLAMNLTNLAGYKATKETAYASYNSSVALYKQTVLAAFQDVEDSLVALSVYEKQIKIQKLSTKQSKHNFELINNQYKAGTIDHSQMLSAKIAYYNSEKITNDTCGLKLTAAIGLIKALGGMW